MPDETITPDPLALCGAIVRWQSTDWNDDVMAALDGASLLLVQAATALRRLVGEREEAEKQWREAMDYVSHRKGVRIGYDDGTFKNLTARILSLEEVVKQETLSSLRAEHEALRGERDKADTGWLETSAHLAHAEELLDARAWAITQLRTALENWGRHFAHCSQRWDSEGEEIEMTPCDCGLSAALQVGSGVERQGAVSEASTSLTSPAITRGGVNPSATSPTAPPDAARAGEANDHG